jgi:sec-independent protein translocase protein TatB
MFNIGPTEFLVIAVIALIVFGPQRLPEIARTVGKALSEFKQQASDIKAEFETSLEIEDEQAAALEDDATVPPDDATVPPDDITVPPDDLAALPEPTAPEGEKDQDPPRDG